MIKRLVFTIFALLLLFPGISLAQSIKIKPGIYTLVNGTPVPLNFSYSVSKVKADNTLGLELSHKTYLFKGASSGVVASDTFILAINPKVGSVEKKFKEYNPFIRSMKPSRLIIVPVKVNAEMGCREYYPGMTLDEINIMERNEMEFEWDEIQDHIFRIKIRGLKNGEYAIFFKHTPILGPDFTAMYGFTIADL